MFANHNPKYTTRRNKGQQGKRYKLCCKKAFLEIVLRLVEQREKRNYFEVILHVKMNIYTHISKIPPCHRNIGRSRKAIAQIRNASLLGRQKPIKAVTAGNQNASSLS